MKLLKTIFGMNTEKVVETGADVAKSFSSKEQGTRRQVNDMHSDSWLSKNIRPLIALIVVGMYLIYLITTAFGIEVSRETGSDIFYMACIVFSFYFPGRTLEKWIKTKVK